MARIDKSTGYYSKTYKALSNILKGYSNWFNNCSKEENINAKEAVRKFYLEYKKCKPEKNIVLEWKWGTFHI